MGLYRIFYKSDQEFSGMKMPEDCLMLAIIELAVRDVLYFENGIPLGDITTFNAQEHMISRYYNAKGAKSWLHDPLATVDTEFSFLWCAQYAFRNTDIDMVQAVKYIRKVTNIEIPFIKRIKFRNKYYTPRAKKLV